MAGNKTIKKVKIKKERLQEALAMNGHTIKEMGESYDIDWSERSLTRFIKALEMPKEALDQVAKFLDVDPEYIKGTYDPSEGLPVDVKASMQRFVKPEKHPYAKKEIREVTVDQYYTALMGIHNLSMEQFIMMDPEERFKFQHEIEDALIPVFRRFFKMDALKADSKYSFMEFDVGIDSIEEAYHMYGLDYWTVPNYAEEVQKREAEMLAKWEL